MVRSPDAAEAAAFELWEDLLRAYAEVIEQQRSFLLTAGAVEGADAAAFEPPLFEIPLDVPPLPAALESWATSLLSETAGLAEIAREILAARPANVRPQRFAPAAGGSTLDQKI
jgi:hypothetical protein